MQSTQYDLDSITFERGRSLETFKPVTGLSTFRPEGFVQQTVGFRTAGYQINLA